MEYMVDNESGMSLWLETDGEAAPAEGEGGGFSTPVKGGDVDHHECPTSGRRYTIHRRTGLSEWMEDEHVDESSGARYLRDKATGETRWAEAGAAAEGEGGEGGEGAAAAEAASTASTASTETAADAAAAKAVAATAAAVLAEKAKNLPAGWEPHLDEASGTTYYYHAGSDSTSWVFPGSW